MSRSRIVIPSYRLHSQSGQAVGQRDDGLGNRRDVLLGWHGTAASRAEYARQIAEWEANGRRLPPRGASPSARRVVPCRLETAEEKPEERTGFRYPDLLAHVRAERPRLVCAGLTLRAGVPARWLLAS